MKTPEEVRGMARVLPGQRRGQVISKSKIERIRRARKRQYDWKKRVSERGTWNSGTDAQIMRGRNTRPPYYEISNKEEKK